MKFEDIEVKILKLENHTEKLVPALEKLREYLEAKIDLAMFEIKVLRRHICEMRDLKMPIEDIEECE